MNSNTEDFRTGCLCGCLPVVAAMALLGLAALVYADSYFTDPSAPPSRAAPPPRWFADACVVRGLFAVALAIGIWFLPKAFRLISERIPQRWLSLLVAVALAVLVGLGMRQYVSWCLSPPSPHGRPAAWEEVRYIGTIASVAGGLEGVLTLIGLCFHLGGYKERVDKLSVQEADNVLEEVEF